MEDSEKLDKNYEIPLVTEAGQKQRSIKESVNATIEKNKPEPIKKDEPERINSERLSKTMIAFVVLILGIIVSFSFFADIDSGGFSSFNIFLSGLFTLIGTVIAFAVILSSIKK